ncbi:nitroreductase family protein, partial [Clostridium estertheticum]
MNENGPIAIKPQGCIACGQCVAVCPTSAIDNIKSPLNKQTTLKKFPVINQETAKQFLRSRRSIRCYKDMAVQRKQLIELVNIARFAPTATDTPTPQGVGFLDTLTSQILSSIKDLINYTYKNSLISLKLLL